MPPKKPSDAAAAAAAELQRNSKQQPPAAAKESPNAVCEKLTHTYVALLQDAKRKRPASQPLSHAGGSTPPLVAMAVDPLAPPTSAAPAPKLPAIVPPIRQPAVAKDGLLKMAGSTATNGLVDATTTAVVAPPPAPPAAGAVTSPFNPAQYYDWARHFGVSVERETEHRRALQATTAPPSSCLGGSTTNKAHHHVTTSSPRRSPSPGRQSVSPAADGNRRRDKSDSYDPLRSCPLSADAGVGLAETTDYSAVDRHALSVVGPAVGLSLEEVLYQLVQPYLLRTWRHPTATDTCHWRVRAIYRWITRFISLTAPAATAPTLGANLIARTPHGTTAAAPKASVTPPPGGKEHHTVVATTAATSVITVTAAPPDVSEAGTVLADELSIAGLGLAAPDTVANVWATRTADPHQVALLFAYMCRHPIAAMSTGSLDGHVDVAAHDTNDLPSVRHEATDNGSAAKALSGHLQPKKAVSRNGTAGNGMPPSSPSSRHSFQRRIVAPPDHLPTVPSIRPTFLVVPGTLKGLLDRLGKTIGFLPWCWNIVVLPDGRRFVVDLAMSMAVITHRLGLTIAEQQLLATSAASPAEGTGGGGKAAKSSAKLTANATSAGAAASSAPSAATASKSASGDAGDFLGATFTSMAAMTPWQSAFTGLPVGPVAAQGALKPPATTYATGVTAFQASPLLLGQTAAELTPTFVAGFFFSDPHTFAALHYPDDQTHLLFRMGGAAVGAAGNGASRQHITSAGGSGGGETSPRKAHHHRPAFLTKSQWEIYPRLAPEFFRFGLSLDSHCRRAFFTSKATPIFVSFLVDDPQSVELKLFVYRCAAQALLSPSSNSAVNIVASDPAATLAALNGYAAPVSWQGTAIGSGGGPSAATSGMLSGMTSAATLPNLLAGGAAPLPPNSPALSLVDSKFIYTSREERSKRVTFCVTVPDVGMYTLCLGARPMSPVTGKPLIPYFITVCHYQTTVAFVPCNEPIFPAQVESPVVAKVVSPDACKIAVGANSFRVAPSSGRVRAVAVVNRVFKVQLPRGAANASSVVQANLSARSYESEASTGDDAAAKATGPRRTPATSVKPAASGKAVTLPASNAASPRDGAAPNNAAAATNVTGTSPAIDRVDMTFLVWNRVTACYEGTVVVYPGLVDLWVMYNDDPKLQYADAHANLFAAAGADVLSPQGVVKVDRVSPGHTSSEPPTGAVAPMVSAAWLPNPKSAVTVALAEALFGVGPGRLAAVIARSTAIVAPAAAVAASGGPSKGHKSVANDAAGQHNAADGAEVPTDAALATPTAGGLGGHGHLSQATERTLHDIQRVIAEAAALGAAAGSPNPDIPELGNDNEATAAAGTSVADVASPTSKALTGKAAAAAAAAAAQNALAAQQQREQATLALLASAVPGSFVPLVTGFEVVKRVSAKEAQLLYDEHGRPVMRVPDAAADRTAVNDLLSLNPTTSTAATSQLGGPLPMMSRRAAVATEGSRYVETGRPNVGSYY